MIERPYGESLTGAEALIKVQEKENRKIRKSSAAAPPSNKRKTKSISPGELIACNNKLLASSEKTNAPSISTNQSSITSAADTQPPHFDLHPLCDDSAPFISSSIQLHSQQQQQDQFYPCYSQEAVYVNLSTANSHVTTSDFNPYDSLMYPYADQQINYYSPPELPMDCHRCFTAVYKSYDSFTPCQSCDRLLCSVCTQAYVLGPQPLTYPDCLIKTP
ncbi:unnamed protein product [Didymodactylos carnosus]|uniref:Uncharacterized protein n=1 Tax=Didymodactylos carnosus TaxID=1234261 RepID=A0A8S2FYI0_9BILA|nr:unnamed protein product [Didymodactylos carnosus]CAF4374794.1 unnamed protein product [Didymodactylos carnosus]